MKATWKLIKTNVRLSCYLPTKASFIANLHECTNCHNIANDRNGLPEVCPWCKAEMTDVVIDKEDATQMMPSLGIIFNAMENGKKGGGAT